MNIHLTKIINLAILSGFVWFVIGCGESKTPPAQKATPAPKIMSPDVVSFKNMALYPEGVEYDPKGKRFLVTSMRKGTVGEVKDDGSYKDYIKDENFVSAVGIRADSERDRLLVCNSDPGASIYTKKENQGKLAGIGIFQLSTGNLIKYLDLARLSDGGGHFCNDIGLDGAGNAYVTDSFSPIIYKVDTNNNASIFMNNERFVGKGFNLNGLVIKDDYLIVAKYNEGILFKIPLNEPEKFTQITIKETFPGADGLLWASDGSLIVIANMDTNKVIKLTSADNWSSAEIVKSSDTGQVFATTGVNRGGDIYALNAMLHVLFNPETKEHVESFDIRKHKL